MVDEVRVERLLRAVADDIAFLRIESGADQDRRDDPAWLRAIKYAFVTAIEACVDVAQHFCASEGWGPPATNADAMVVLGRHGVLDADLARQLGRAVGFRNVLVHEYVTVDDALVVRRLADLSDLDGFTSAVARWMTEA
ncbi:type VII toxin-antitoxin system HepT family RNase toxin [Actinomycetospora sp. C-140]